jgi:DNA-binding CsgD family transcriptional regulator
MEKEIFLNSIRGFRQSPLTSYYVKIINELCKPLFLNTPITAFSYCKIHSSTSRSILTTNIDWHNNLFNKGYYKNACGYIYEPEINNGYYLKGIQGIENEKELQDARENFDLDHLFCIKHGLEKFTFYTSRDNNDIHNFYRNNYEVLEHFILYFKDIGAEIIKESNNNPMSIYLNPSINKGTSNLQSSHDMLHGINLNNVYLHLEDDPIILSHKEARTAVLITQGLTAAQIGQYLNVSQRTIEPRLANIKFKFNAKNKKRLISNFSKISINTDILYNILFKK